MIYTVTFNPSLDYIVTIEQFQLGMTNRTAEESIVPGGKGLNVSMVLQNLGVENTALGFVAGFTGEEIVRRMEELGVKSDFIPVEQGVSRINVKLNSMGGTEINGRGPDISQEKVQELLDRLEVLGNGDVLVLAGSIPPTIPSDIYRSIMERLEGRGIMIVVDATGELLTKVLEYHPFLIKPNHHELGEIFGVKLNTREEVIPYGRELQKLGAENVLISMGSKGAVLIAEDGQVLEAAAPEGELKNAVGAGDSMVAGFLTGWLEQQDYRHAFRMGIGAGSASAFSEKLAIREEVEELYQKVRL